MRKISIILLSFLSIAAYSQTNTYSPYSRYGLGELVHPGLAANKAMGGTGIGLRLPNTLNYMNPASYTVQDTLSFIFDFGLYSNFTTYKTDSISSQDLRSSLDHIIIGFPITRWWKSSLGLVPYSRMGYDIKDLKFINYSLTKAENFELYYKGTGGINHFYLGNAFKLKNLSLGFNVNVLFGSLEQTHSYSTETDYIIPTTRSQQQTIRSTSLTFGAQYDIKFSDDLSVVVGGIFETRSRLVAENNLLVTNEYTFLDSLVDPYRGEPYGNLRSIDTIDYVNETNKNNHIPMKYGAGLSVNFKNRIILSADYSTQKWSDYKSLNVFDNLTDSKSLNFGLQYTPDDKAIRNYWKRIGIRAGYYSGNTYLKISDQQIKESGFTLGLRLPFKGNKSAFQLSYEYGKLGTTSHGLMQENYHMFNLGISLYDFWFVKSKYD